MGADEAHVAVTVMFDVMVPLALQLSVQVCPEDALKPHPVTIDLVQLGGWKPQPPPMSH